MPITKKKFETSKDIHQEIVDAVSKYYNIKGFSIHAPVQLGRFLADVIAVRDQNLVIAIEAKKDDLSEIRKGVGQALSYMEWVHKVYLAIPLSRIQICQELLKDTPIGIISIAEDQLLIAKEADLKEPDRTKLYQLLHKTTGFCWLCSKTFNIIEPAERPDFEKDSLTIARTDDDPVLISQLEQVIAKKIKKVNFNVGICKVCSRILGEAISQYMHILLGDEKFVSLDFGWAGKEVTINSLQHKIRTLISRETV